ncbi:hypothetical protein DFH11DRAFT_442454 [Phellopilus nigrolimitatus]|nr:hypothetical protein DFH11DRAFT_442454 [Phellopilus nigrolimitatus]
MRAGHARRLVLYQPLRALFSFQADLRRVSAQKASRRRCFSASATAWSNPYPYPNSQDPTPYQVFHLQTDASPADVKQRYYELVRLYHPDSAESRRLEPDPAVRHARFSAITRAYTHLTKRPTSDGSDGTSETGEGFANRWRRAPHAHKRPYFEDKYVDERWKERFMWGTLTFAVLAVAAQSFSVRQRRNQLIADHVTESPLSSWKPPENSSRRNEADEDAMRLKGRP